MRISDWSSDVCSSDLALAEVRAEAATHARAVSADKQRAEAAKKEQEDWRARAADAARRQGDMAKRIAEAEAEAERLADAPLSLAAQLDGLEAESTAAAEAARAAAAHERDAQETLRETAQRLTTVGEATNASAQGRERG